MEYNLEFTPDVNWKAEYYRNFKNKNSKHVLCFPDHNIGGHKSSKFCGRSITVNVTYPKDERILICANFGKYGESDDEIKINNIVTHERIKYKKNSLFPYYIGTSTRNQTIYEINSKLNAWTMNDRLSKDCSQYTFNVYMLVKMNNTKSSYRCVCIAKSPAFSVISSRRCRYTKLKKEIHTLDTCSDEEECECVNSLTSSHNSPSPTDVKSNSVTDSDFAKDNGSLFNYEIRVTETDAINRHELSFSGMTLEEAKEQAKVGYVYLDKYGNKHCLKAAFNEKECDGYLTFYE